MSAAIEDSKRVNLDEVPLCALSPSTRNLLCNLLNPKKLIPSDDNLLRDWRGLAQLAGVRVPADSKNPTDSVLSTWVLSSNEECRPTLGILLTLLGQIDRWDVHDDLKEKMENDAGEYLGRMNKPSVPSPINMRDLITNDDLSRYRQGLELQKYDAFFLYADEDKHFANDIVTLLEDEFGLRLCLRDRDLLGGLTFEHDAIMRLISSRCSHLIVIISSHFINSEAHKFFFNYAQALSIHLGTRKIIPCVYNACALQVPHEFKFYFLLDYSRSSSFRNFCERLRNSIEPRTAPALPAPPLSTNVREVPSEQRCTIEEVSSEVHSKCSISSSVPEVRTQIVEMPDPSAFLSPEKSKLDFEVSAESSLTTSKSESKTGVSKPRSPAVRFKNIFRTTKSADSSAEATSNETQSKTVQPKAKKQKWKFPLKKKVAVAEL